MQFHFLTRDGLAQHGHLKTDHESISIPQMIYTITPPIDSPDHASLVLKDKTTDPFHPVFTISSSNNKTKEKKQILFTIDSPHFFPSILPDKIHRILDETYPFEHNTAFVTSGHLPDSLKESTKHIQMTIISHAYQLYLHPKELSTYLHTLRSLIPPDSLIYLPAIANAQNLSVLIYLGTDLVDSSQSILAAKENIMFFPNGNRPITSFETIPCHCPICTRLKQNPKNYTFDDILFHNYHMMETELSHIKQAIMHETLREHVLVRTSNSPHLTSIIRQAEYDPTGVLEKKTPRYKQSILKATNIDACFQPEVKRFQQTIINHYRKPDHTSILLLLPCSAKKPYSFSKTHKRFQRVIQQVSNHQRIHELIITSPLGIVPRELELMYPASSYDIPVTHNWFEDELTMITSLLNTYLASNQYHSIVCYLREDLQKRIKKTVPTAILPDISVSPTNQNDLENLTAILSNLLKDQDPVSVSQRRKDDMYCRARVQFTPEIAQILLKDTHIKGKYPYLKIFDETQTQLGMLTEKRGMISLTLQGAERIISSKRFQVHISTDFTLKGSVFAPGVIDADPDIRKGDEVLVIQKNILQAVGVAFMDGDEMVQRTHGKAVDIRHHR